jgi:hypothetical protein
MYLPAAVVAVHMALQAVLAAPSQLALALQAVLVEAARQHVKGVPVVEREDILLLVVLAGAATVVQPDHHLVAVVVAARHPEVEAVELDYLD